MPKLALLKKVSFGPTNSNISLYLSDKVSFHEFDGTVQLFHKINKLLGNGMIEILNCDYDEKYLMQAFYLENTQDELYENIVITKRLINENDNYIYTTEPELLIKDTFTHVDVTFEDIERIMLRKNSSNGVQMGDNNIVSNINYTISYNHDLHTGTLNIINTTDTVNTVQLKFLNYPSLIKQFEKDNLTSEQLSKLVSDKISELGCEYFYTQKEFGLGLLNCYCPLFGHTKNEFMSQLLSENICGTSYVGLENNLNEDNRILPLNNKMISKILNFLSVNNYKQKNRIFCNIFYELSDF